MTRIQRGALLVVATVVLALSASALFSRHAVAATPPPDCNTPNQSGGTGVLETPQNTNGNGQPFLTKALTATTPGAGSTRYDFQLTTTRSVTSDTGSGASVTYAANTLTDSSKAWTVNQWAHATVTAGASVSGTVASNTATTLTLTSNWSTTPAAGTPYVISFFSELLDCAWDVTQSGNAATANYASQQNTPRFAANGHLAVSLTATNSDAICDRVQLKGTDPSGTPFVDYSNLVGSPSGTACTLPVTTPEVPTTALFVLVGGGGLAAAVAVSRRRGRLHGPSAAA